MAYKGREYTGNAGGSKTSGDVIVDSISVRPKGGIISVFVKSSAGTATAFTLLESIDGEEWEANATTATAFGTSWGVITFKDPTAAAFPVGTLLQLRANGNITVEKVLVVQDW